MKSEMNEGERRRLEEIWTRFIAREAVSPEERTELAAALERDQGLRVRMLHDLQLDGALRGAGEAERHQESVVSVVRALVTAAGRTEEVVAAVRKQLEAKESARTSAAGPRSRSQVVSPPPARLSRMAIAVVVVGVIAALALLVPRFGRDRGSRASAPDDHGGSGLTTGGRDDEEARAQQARAPAGATRDPHQRVVLAHLEAIEGAVYRHGADGTVRAAPTLDLGAGDWVSTAGATTRVRLAGPGGSRIDLAGDAVAALSADAGNADGARLFLAQGRAMAVVPVVGGGAPIILASPHAIISGTGSVRLEVGPAVTRVEVIAGRARVSALGVQRSTDVEAGQFALVRADDLQPPLARTVREAMLLIGPDDTKEEIVPAGTLHVSEERLKARLERLGFDVSIAEASAVTPERARAAAVLVFSSSVSSNLLEPWFAELPVPILMLESTGFEQLGLSGGHWKRDIGATAPLSEVVIANPGHALAAGLSGTVRVLASPIALRWAAPPASAVRVATFAGAPDQAVVQFGYEKGAATAGGAAPARRVGLFLGNGRVIRALTEDGWRLFDAAALWAAGS